jgi:hypothetical protein
LPFMLYPRCQNMVSGGESLIYGPAFSMAVSRLPATVK